MELTAMEWWPRRVVTADCLDVEVRRALDLDAS